MITRNHKIVFGVLISLVLIQAIALITDLWPRSRTELLRGHPFRLVCDGQYRGGAKLSEREIKQVLEKHSQWLQTYSTKALRMTKEAYQDNRKANLCGADLSTSPAGIFKGAVLTGADLTWSDFSRVNLTGANLEEADLHESIFDDAKLQGAKINGNLFGTNFHKANLEFADLRHTSLLGGDLSDAKLQASKTSDTVFIDVNFTTADLRGIDLERSILTRVKFFRAEFEPRNVSESLIMGSEGLSTIVFLNPKNLVKLRNLAKESGLRNEQKALTAALRKFAMANDTPYEQFLQTYILGGWITDYGANPMGSIVLLLMLVPIWSVFYYLCLLQSFLPSDLWKVWPTECLDDIANRRSSITEGLGEDGGQYFWVFCWSFYFSLLSAFRIGWRDFNFGSWISRLQFDNYELRAKGLIRTFSGIQSILSVYLFALWLLTYFGTPFE
ncbi:MAG: pentapeptide repeat-containing protein [Nitrospira sp.]|nr:MAG: pentapeptide repeat-containing protein [Nitrospira sp.]